MRISRGPNRARPAAIPNAPIARIQVGTATTVPALPPTAATMAARGPMAFATSLAPWAKESRGGGGDQRHGEQRAHRLLRVVQRRRPACGQEIGRAHV